MEYICKSNTHQRVLIVTDIHYCDRVWCNADKDERADALCRALQTEYEERPYDMILCLGDYSLDFWEWETCGSYLGTPSVSYTEKFVQNVMPRFPLKPYLIPGNHEQYGNEKWQQITGFPRQFSVVYGDYVFLMLDTFAGNLDPTEHSDGTYTGIDTAYVCGMLQKYPDKTMVLCVHDLKEEKESEEARQLIAENPRILCAFAGHIHMSHTKMLGRNWRNFPVIYCGDFSYSGQSDCNWGYQTIDFSEGFSTEYHRV